MLEFRGLNYISSLHVFYKAFTHLFNKIKNKTTGLMGKNVPNTYYAPALSRFRIYLVVILTIIYISVQYRRRN